MHKNKLNKGYVQKWYERHLSVKTKTGIKALVRNIMAYWEKIRYITISQSCNVTRMRRNEKIKQKLSLEKDTLIEEKILKWAREKLVWETNNETTEIDGKGWAKDGSETRSFLVYIEFEIF